MLMACSLVEKMQLQLGLLVQVLCII